MSGWYKTWFDSEYYHILYKDRDDNEAKQFIDNLINYYSISAGEKVLDLACGKGRHSVYLNQKGLDVVGVDLSNKSIAHAKRNENPTLKFQVHDMRETLRENTFDYVLSFFTSFGYFDDQEDDRKVINSVYDSLTVDGYYVIDFMNTNRIIKSFKESELKEIDTIKFEITRSVNNGFITKQINFDHKAQDYQFEEKVRAYKLVDFELIFDNKFKIINTFGNYELQDFDEDTSNRLIIIAQKLN
ncbi:MAG: methyltransferase domain-containing protein [Bacteroidia bacterium]|nr:methyltransferase domain-containing protein [Bacteroidia bacterium]